ncbi:MAG: glycosyltransferase [Pseudomonadota bacterium]|nr:glycosyltransferase [Pseudomonadota bacterium]
MKISVITARYSFTGVALAQTRLARALAERGHHVDMIFGCLDDGLPAEARKLPSVPGVAVVDWGVGRVRQMFVAMCRYLRTAKPDVIFSAEDHLNHMILLAAIVTRSRAKISGSSRVLPVDAFGHDGPYSNRRFSRKWIFKQLAKCLMWRADALTCVSEDMVGEYRKLFKNAPHVCVHNIIVDEASKLRMAEPVDHEWFVKKDVPIVAAAGTLTTRKGFVDLVRAVGRLKDRGREVRLAIFGEGAMRQELESLVDQLGLTGSVWLPGRVDNPLKYFARSDVSVLSSYSEGLPNVLVEAMMCGCTPIATDCPTGPREVLQDGRYGYLVPMHDPDAMAEAIDLALAKPIPAETLAEAVRRFEVETVLDQHFRLLRITESGR